MNVSEMRWPATTGRVTHCDSTTSLKRFARTASSSCAAVSRCEDAPRSSSFSGARGRTERDRAGVGSKRIVRHNVANIRFTGVSLDEARVACYFTVFTEIGLDHYGRYRDVFLPAAMTG